MEMFPSKLFWNEFLFLSATCVSTKININVGSYFLILSNDSSLQGRTNEYTIGTLCSMMTDKSLGSPLKRYAAVNRMMLAGPIQLTLDCSYKNMIKEMSLVNWNGPQGMLVRFCSLGLIQKFDLGESEHL